QFIAIVNPDLISYDHYDFKTDVPSDPKRYFENLGLVASRARQTRRPFLNIIQANTIAPNWRLPTAAGLRWLVFTTLAYGGRGISYFTYWGPVSYNGLYKDGTAAPLLKTVVALNKELAVFGHELFALDSLGVYHTQSLFGGADAIPVDSPVQLSTKDGVVLGLFGKDANATAFMIVNRDVDDDARVGVTVSMADSRIEELDRVTGEWVPSRAFDSRGRGQVKLRRGDAMIFRFASY